MSFSKILLSVAIGAGIGASSIYFALPYLGLSQGQTEQVQQTDEKKPLYWVAPMDANYRRDGPGKSPMGMDLVPVYEEPDMSAEYGEGAMSINPTVQNNLGVRTASARLKVAEQNIETVGFIQYSEDKLFHIHPRVEGWIDNLFIKAQGEVVKKGEPLYSMYSLELLNAQQELLVALNNKEPLLIKAAKQRLLSLNLTNAFIEKLERTRTIENSVIFYAQQSGIVEAMQIRDGFYVAPGNTLMSIGQLDEVWVEASVFEKDAGKVKSGQTVTMTLEAFPEKVWQGQVEYVYPTLDAVTRSVRVRIRFDNKDQLLKPNMYSQITIRIDDSQKRLLIPKSAIIQTQGQDRVVLAYGDGFFKSVAVQTGLEFGQDIEIVRGLEVEDSVVVSGQFLIDSESAKNSDFLRMAEVKDELASATVDGVINSIDLNSSVLNISRGPIEKWDRGPATMDFVVSADIDLSTFKVGQSVNFTFEVDDDFVVTDMVVIESNSGDKS